MNWFRKKLVWILQTGLELQKAKESIFVFLSTGEKFDQMNYQLEVSHTTVFISSPQSNEKSE